MKQISIYISTGFQLQDLLKKSKISELIHWDQIEKITGSLANVMESQRSRIYIRKPFHILAGECISIIISRQFNYMYKNAKEEREDKENQVKATALTYPQNAKIIQKEIEDALKYIKKENIFITYKY